MSVAVGVKPGHFCRLTGLPWCPAAKDSQADPAKGRVRGAGFGCGAVLGAMVRWVGYSQEGAASQGRDRLIRQTDWVALAGGGGEAIASRRIGQSSSAPFWRGENGAVINDPTPAGRMAQRG